MKKFTKALIPIIFFISCENEPEPKDKYTLNNANSEFSSGNYADALKVFDEVIKKDPSSTKAYSGRGFTNLRLSKITPALADLNKALSLDEKNTDALAARALIYLYQNKFSEAISDAKSLLTNDSNYEFTLDKSINKMDIYYIQAFAEYSSSEYANAYATLKSAGSTLSFVNSSPTISAELLSPLMILLNSVKSN